MSKIRRKGAAIVETSRGILVVAGRSKKFILPGGGANKGESRKMAAIRELHEETGLRTKRIKYLFSYVGGKWHTHSGNSVRNHAKVFLINATGKSRPRHEIKYIDFWNPKSKIHITHGTKKVIDKYLIIKNG
ncbi:RNA pyrophosphohydrolase [uncultured archaeon]|nr:RNA pyrophosphohydrolase [uncultured archaeon]